MEGLPLDDWTFSRRSLRYIYRSITEVILARTLSTNYAIAGTTFVVAIYCLRGGLRASVWTDLLQASIMLLVTTLMLIVGGRAMIESETLHSLVPFEGMSAIAVVVFLLGWAAAGTGFSLSQPQIVVRFLAGRSEEDVRRAKWVYLGFLHYTWIGMTMFGVAAREFGMNFNDGEIVLPSFVLNTFSPFFIALVLAGIFSAIASTIDSIVLGAGAILSVDVLPAILGKNEIFRKRGFHMGVAAMFLVTVALVSVSLNQSVMTLAAMAVTMLAATIAPAVLLRTLFPDISPLVLLMSIILGGIGFATWRLVGASKAFPYSESIVGVIVFLTMWCAITAKNTIDASGHDR